MLVSVYIPARNRRTLLAEAGDSVVRQTYANVEIVVSNDGSTDDTSEYLAKLEKSEPRLVVLNSTRALGAPQARNRAVLRATGDFVTGLDDDDRFREDRIERFVEEWTRIADTGGISCLFSQSLLVDGATLWYRRSEAARDVL